MDSNFKYSHAVLGFPLVFVVLLWVVYWFEIRFQIDLSEHGIYPRTLAGFQGVVFSPFLHGNLEHLYNNSIPLFVLLVALRYFYSKQFLPIISYGILLSGSITWLIGRSNFHIGASSLIYVLVSFIFFKGIQTRYYRLVALSLTVIMLYGGMVWFMFPTLDTSISWEGHLAGFISGYAFSFIFKTPEYHKPVFYEWEHPDFNPQNDPFMKRFDENGNFVNPPKPEEIEVTYEEVTSHQPFQYVYVFKENREEAE